MQFSVVFATLAAVAAIAVATPTPRTGECNTGPVHCCDKVTNAGDADAQGVINSVGAIVDDLTVSVGLECNPFTVIGGGAGSW